MNVYESLMVVQGAVHRLVASQYKIAPDKLMRTGNINTAMGEDNTGNSAKNYGLTGGCDQKFKASYLAYLLQCVLTDYASRKA